MKFADSYLKKQSQYIKQEILGAPSGLLKYVVIIPAYSEPDIYNTLNSLLNCTPPAGKVEVFILINCSISISEDIKEQNRKAFQKLLKWCTPRNEKWINFYPFLIDDLPEKYAGAGLARKLLMDFAVSRFNQLDNPDGFIFSLDADTLVPANYFTKVEDILTQHPQTNCLIFNFCHPLQGREYSSKVYHAILLYEMHLRYYRQILHKTGFPYSFYTIGSCFGVRTEIYMKVGGMNKRKAGEDFYFLNKVFPFNQTLFLEDIILVPSVRPSWRVPFGTGPAIRKILGETNTIYKTYNPVHFSELKQLFSTIQTLYQISSNDYINSLPDYLKLFLINQNALKKVEEIKSNTSTLETFTRRFYQWFDAFMIIRYLNDISSTENSMIDVNKAVKHFLGITNAIESNELLTLLRKNDKT